MLMRGRIALSLAVTLGAVIGVARAKARADRSPTALAEFLEQKGLGCCIDVITRRNGWLCAGGAVDAPGDLHYLTDDIIKRLPIPKVKQNILTALATDARDEAERRRREDVRDEADRRRREAWTRHWFENLLAAAETISRGFTLGFGLSFIYETLVLSTDFYTAVEDLGARVQLAIFRAAVLGLAVAVTAHGASLFVPFSIRNTWVSGRVGLEAL